MNLIVIIKGLFLLKVIEAVQWCEKDIYEMKLYELGKHSDAVAIWYPIRAGVSTTIPLCSYRTGLPIQRHCSYNHCGFNATWDELDKPTNFLNCSAIHNNCRSEEFKHFYLRKDNKKEIIFTNRWHSGNVGEYAKTQRLCLLATGLPLTRRCVYNSLRYTATWELKNTHNIKCYEDMQQNIVTNDLDKLYQDIKGGSAEPSAVLLLLIGLLAKANTTRIPADLELSTSILKTLTEYNRDPKMVASVLKVASLLMESNANVIDNAKSIDIPNTLVKTLERYHDEMAKILVSTSKCHDVPDGVYSNSASLISVFYINPACSNISGIAIYSTSTHPTASMHYDAASNSYYRYVYMHEQLEDIMKDPNIQVATYFPRHTWDTLFKDASTGDKAEVIRLSLYKNKHLFYDQKTKGYEPVSVVLAISVPGYQGK